MLYIESFGQQIEMKMKLYLGSVLAFVSEYTNWAFEIIEPTTELAFMWHLFSITLTKNQRFEMGQLQG